MQHLYKVLTEIRKAGLKIKPAKYQWFKTKLRYLRYIIFRKGIITDPNNIAKLQQMYPPRNVKDVQSFLGFCNFYKRFIQDFAHIAHPLIQLTRKSTEWK